MSDRGALLRRAAPLLLLVLLAAATLAPSTDVARLAGGGDAAATWTAELDALPNAPTLLVAFDPDTGTYPEVRPAVRTALADLLARDARLAFVSLTPEGRALLSAELDRLARRQANPQRILTLGFLPGAEAAIAGIARRPPVPAEAEGAIARAVASRGSGAFDAVLVVGGNDLGPRPWVEQYLPRVDPVPLLAITPTVLLPEVVPFVATGQVDALLGTPAGGAAYAASVELGTLDRLADARTVPPLAALVGVVVALAVLVPAWISGIAAVARRSTSSRGGA